MRRRDLVGGRVDPDQVWAYPCPVLVGRSGAITQIEPKRRQRPVRRACHRDLGLETIGQWRPSVTRCRARAWRALAEPGAPADADPPPGGELGDVELPCAAHPATSATTSIARSDWEWRIGLCLLVGVTKVAVARSAE